MGEQRKEEYVNSDLHRRFKWWIRDRHDAVPAWFSEKMLYRMDHMEKYLRVAEKQTPLTQSEKT